MGQHQSDRPHLAQRIARHLRSAACQARHSDIHTGVCNRHQAKCAGPLQNTQVAGVVQVRILKGRMQLDSLQSQGRDPIQFLLPIGKIRVNAPKGEEPLPA